MPSFVSYGPESVMSHHVRLQFGECEVCIIVCSWHEASRKELLWFATVLLQRKVSSLQRLDPQRWKCMLPIRYELWYMVGEFYSNTYRRCYPCPFETHLGGVRCNWPCEYIDMANERRGTPYGMGSNPIFTCTTVQKISCGPDGQYFYP